MYAAFHRVANFLTSSASTLGWEGGKEGAVPVAQAGLQQKQQKRQMSRHLIRNKSARAIFHRTRPLAFKTNTLRSK